MDDQQALREALAVELAMHYVLDNRSPSPDLRCSCGHDFDGWTSWRLHVADALIDPAIRGAGWGPTAAHPDEDSGLAVPSPAAHLPSDQSCTPPTDPQRREPTMHVDYRVRSVTLSAYTALVALDPGDWMKDDPTGKMETSGGEEYPAAVEAEPGEPGAEFFDKGGKPVELQVDADTDLRPGDFVTLTLTTVTQHADA